MEQNNNEFLLAQIAELRQIVEEQQNQLKQQDQRLNQKDEEIKRQNERLSQKEEEIKSLRKFQKQTTTKLNVIDSCFSEFNKDLGINELIQRAQDITKTAVNKNCDEKTADVNFYMPDGTGKFFTLDNNGERICIESTPNDNTAVAEALFNGKPTVSKTYNGQYDVGDGITEPPAKNLAVIPIKTDNSRIAGIAVIRNKSDNITQADLDTVNNVTNVFNSAFENRMLDAENKVLQTDKLTGLTNRHGVAKYLSNECLNAFDNNKNVTVGFFDIDNFKKFNDTYGHDIGDMVLKQTANTIKSECRSDVDCAFRFGGEEMGVIFPGMSEAQALPVMDRIREKISNCQLDIGNNEKISITVSGGIAAFTENEKNSATKNNIYSAFENGPLKRADENLYHSKEKGKNQITASPEVMAEYKKSQQAAKSSRFNSAIYGTNVTPTFNKNFGDLGE